MRSVGRLTHLYSRTLQRSLPAPIENRICYYDNRICCHDNRVTFLQQNYTITRHYQSSVEYSVPEDEQKSVNVAIVGSPNVGKSTLLNTLMQQYISPVSRLRNTTQANVLGVITQDNIQVVFVDTPGLLPGQFKQPRRGAIVAKQYQDSLEAIQDSLSEADVALFLFDCSQSLYKLFLTADMERIFESVPEIPKILVLNKIDKAREGSKMECIIEQLTQPLPPLPVPAMAERTDIDPSRFKFRYEDDFRDGREFHEVVSVSALQGTHVNYLWYKIRQLAVTRPWQYPPDTVSPDDMESVVTAVVRAEVLQKCGYYMAYSMDSKFIGYREENDKIIVEFAIFRNRAMFKTAENKEDSVRHIGDLLSKRFGCQVEFRLFERWHSGQKADLLDILDLEEEPDIEISEE